MNSYHYHEIPENGSNVRFSITRATVPKKSMWAGTGDLILTTNEEATQTEWLQNTQWLKVLEGRARIKKREFIIIAHGIRVN
jgi:hypothetical protein